ncbi:MAG: hypothetical protein WAK55_33815 [Xanthobacteraceae bacterium]
MIWGVLAGEKRPPPTKNFRHCHLARFEVAEIAAKKSENTSEINKSPPLQGVVAEGGNSPPRHLRHLLMGGGGGGGDESDERNTHTAKAEMNFKARSRGGEIDWP